MTSASDCCKKLVTLHHIVYVALIFSLLSLSVVCFRWSIADINASQVIFHLDVVDNSSSNKDLHAWQIAQKQLNYMLMLRPNDAQYLDFAEYFYDILCSLEQSRPDLITALALQKNDQEALRYARSALKLRPTWPNFWKEYAKYKIKLHQFDAELFLAYQQAVKLGRWEKFIQYKLAKLGVGHWDDMGIETRQWVLQAAEQTLVIEDIDFQEPRKLAHLTNITKVCPMLESVQGLSFPKLIEMCATIEKVK